MTLPIGSKWTERRNSTSIWKLSDISFRSALEYMVKTLMNFLDEVIVSSSKNLVLLGKSNQSPMLLLIRCKNLGKLLLLSSTEVYLERQPVLTSFINNRGHKKQEKMYYPRLTKVIIHYFLTKDKTVSRRNKIGMHTSRDDHLINILRFVPANEVSQIYGARLPESMTSPEMRETKAYKTYLGYATGVTPPKKAK
ncbi:hypothetical protein Tco_0260264 [Tanacetum coccineum]